jgi:pyruvate dehydrogenase phosphatase
MAMLDTAHQNLYVACTGDSRAVAGIWEESAGGGGRWRADVLTEDQTGRNPNELKRYDLDLRCLIYAIQN